MRTRRDPPAPARLALKPSPSVPDYIASSAVPPRATLGDDAAKARMAEDMREAVYREGGLDRDGLELLGYTADQIDRLAGPARRRANQLAHLTA